MKVLRPGTEFELQLQPTTKLQQCWILPFVPGQGQIHASTVTQTTQVRFLTLCATERTPWVHFLREGCSHPFNSHCCHYILSALIILPPPTHFVCYHQANAVLLVQGTFFLHLPFILHCWNSVHPLKMVQITPPPCGLSSTIVSS